MTTARPAARRLLALALLPVALALPACDDAVEGAATPEPPADRPASPAELERLLVTEVPGGLPRLPDDDVHPPAGEKQLEDVAAYAADPARERAVLEDYGYLHGWERFWGRDSGPMTGIFVDQFERRAGAGAYAEDLARNDAELYGGLLSDDPPDLPPNCRELTVADPVSGADLADPAAFAWCWHGVFSVAVTAVGPSADEAVAEVRAVMDRQLALLPPG